MGLGQFECIKKELDDINSAIGFLENISLYIENEKHAVSTPDVLLNDATDIINASVMKFINLRLTTIAEHLSKMEE